MIKTALSCEEFDGKKVPCWDYNGRETTNYYRLFMMDGIFYHLRSLLTWTSFFGKNIHNPFAYLVFAYLAASLHRCKELYSWRVLGVVFCRLKKHILFNTLFYWSCLEMQTLDLYVKETRYWRDA